MNANRRVTVWTPPRVLVTGFAFIILLGSLLLMLPQATETGEATPYLDALFTSTSAVCVTGLVTVDTGIHWSTFGEVIILILIQIGGLGFMTMTSLIALLIGKKISLRERLVMQQALNHGSLEGIIRLVRRVIIYSLVIEAAAAIYYTVHWSSEMPFARAFYYGVFHAVSFFNNAGFDLLGEGGTAFSSIIAYKHDLLFNGVTMVLIIVGGLGFIVLSDLISWSKLRRLSLHSKVVLSASGSLIAIGALVFLLFEYTNPLTLHPLTIREQGLISLFQSVTTRSEGLTTIDLVQLREATQFVLILFMFIGAAPGSTGGGMKVTTFMILHATLVSILRGKEEVVLFRHRIPQSLVFKALTITMLAIIFVISITLLLSITESIPFFDLLFETTSAFGTVGLSLGVTPQLSELGKIIILLTMFAGRLGPVTLAFAFGAKSERALFRYPEGKITIG